MVSKVKQFNQGEWYQALQPTPVNEHRSAASGDLAIFVEEADDEVLVLIEGSQFRIKRELFLANFVKVEDGEARLNRQINDLISTGQELAAEIKAAESQFSKIQNAFQLRGQADPDSVPPTTENERAELIILRQDLIVRKMGEEIARQRDEFQNALQRLSEYARNFENKSLIGGTGAVFLQYVESAVFQTVTLKEPETLKERALSGRTLSVKGNSPQFHFPHSEQVSAQPSLFTN